MRQMEKKKKNIYTIGVLVIILIGGLFFSGVMEKIICEEWSYEECISKAIEEQTCYQTCYRNLETCDVTEVFGKIYKNGEWVCDTDGSMEALGWTFAGCRETPSCYCSFKKCITTVEEYQCNPYPCNPTEVCTNWETKTSLARPAESEWIKNIHCTREVETCGNGVCEPAYNENEENCLADCYKGPCEGVNIDDNNPCTDDFCDSVTGEITHVPIQTFQCMCEGIETDDNDECTEDSIIWNHQLQQCEVVHKEIPGCRFVSPVVFPIDNLVILIGILSIVLGIGIVVVKQKVI